MGKQRVKIYYVPLDLPDFGTLSTLLTDSRVAIDRLLARFPCQFLVVCENTVAAFY